MAAVKRLLQGFWQPDISTKEPVSLASHEDGCGYNKSVEYVRESEYPTLVGTTYLDHAGTAPYPKSAIESWTTELTSNLFGNPHSASASSQLSTRRIDDIRLKVLHFFNASPDDFAVVFVANATAAIKLVAEAFRDDSKGFWYAYHNDSHTSLIGPRELASCGSKCFASDEDVEQWLEDKCDSTTMRECLKIFAYPAQSNMTGRQLPSHWPKKLREAASKSGSRIYTLLDAASLAATSPMDLSDPACTPDFISISFYKIFGFPDLGALLVRKDSAGPLLAKKYFAGGTVDAVVTDNSTWYARKDTIHTTLEEGTLPFHNILALDHAITAHARLFGSMHKVSAHTNYLREKAKAFLTSLRHNNNAEVCEIYEGSNNHRHGPVLSFNLKTSSGHAIGASEVEKLCIIKGIQLRTGGLCNPGGIARHLRMSTDQIRSNYHAGHRCGGESEILDGRPTGVLRISFGAMSTKQDLQNFATFIQEYYVEENVLKPAVWARTDNETCFYIDSLHIFPIKSCAAFDIQPQQSWPVTARGLAWDREWCLVHAGTNTVLSQKKYPRMSLLRPHLDLKARKMLVTAEIDGNIRRVNIDLDTEGTASINQVNLCPRSTSDARISTVCGDSVVLQWCTSSIINDFFSEVLDVPCCLARYPQSSKARKANIRSPSNDKVFTGPNVTMPEIMLANESPILVVSKSSVEELNSQIKTRATQEGRTLNKKISATSFRANIVVSPVINPGNAEIAYAEDHWCSISILPKESWPGSLPRTQSPACETSITAISNNTSRSRSSTTSLSESNSIDSADGGNSMTSTSLTDESLVAGGDKVPVKLDILGPCQRCQMVSIDQITAKSQPEPFSTLAKTRRKGDGRVWFGMHAALSQLATAGESYVQIGDLVRPITYRD